MGESEERELPLCNDDTIWQHLSKATVENLISLGRRIIHIYVPTLPGIKKPRK